MKLKILLEKFVKKIVEKQQVNSFQFILKDEVKNQKKHSKEYWILWRKKE